MVVFSGMVPARGLAGEGRSLDDYGGAAGLSDGPLQSREVQLVRTMQRLLLMTVLSACGCVGGTRSSRDDDQDAISVRLAVLEDRVQLSDSVNRLGSAL